MHTNCIKLALIGAAMLIAAPAFAGDAPAALLQLAELEAPIAAPAVKPPTRLRTFRAPVANSAYVCSLSGFGHTSKCKTRPVASRNVPVRVEVSER